MATHDYVIANGTGQAVRSDINDALAAIVSNNSGSSEPATTYAYQWWADTTANVLKIRNSANNAWITLRELDGTMLIEDGTAAAPGLSFASDTDTGIFKDGTNSIALAAAGNERFSCSDSSVIVNQDGDDVDFRVESDGKTHMLYVDGGTNLIGIDESAPTSLLSIGGNAATTAKPTVSVVPSSGDASISLRGGSPTIAFDVTSGGDGTIVYDSSSDLLFKKGTLDSSSEVARINEDGSLLIGSSVAASAGDAQYAYLQIAGNTAGISGSVLALKRGESASQMSDDDSLGTIIFTGTTGGDFASIRGSVDGSPSGSDFPGRIVFSTTADGGNTPTERMRISSDGTIQLTAATNGSNQTIQFGDPDANNRGLIQYRHATDALHIYTAGSQAAMIDSSGRLLVGTTAGAAGRIVHASNSGSNSAYFHSTNGSSGTGSSDGVVMGMGDATNAYFWNYESGSVQFATSGSARLTINSSGNVGVGTASIASGGANTTNFNVHTPSATSVYLKLSNSSTGNTASDAFDLSADSSGNAYLINRENGMMQFWTNATERMRIDSVGQLYQYSNQHNFDSSSSTIEFVNRNSGGAKEFKWYIGASGTSPIASLSTAGVWTDASDVSNKTNIQEIGYGIETVKLLLPRQYDVISNGEHAVGFVAQEVQDVVPEVVNSTIAEDGTEFLGLAYGQLTAVLTKALQEAIAKIEALETKVAALEAG